MKVLAVLLVLVIALASASAASADDEVSPFPSSVVIGQQFEVTIQVEAPTGAEVEFNTVADGWNGVEVVRVELVESQAIGGGQTRHTFNLTLAAFALGQLEVIPSIFITQDGLSDDRDLPASTLTVASVLPENAPLQLSPLETPGPVAGAQSPWLVPIVVASIALAVASFLALTVWLMRWWRRRPRTVVAPVPAASAAPDLGAVESELLTNPIAAYRAMAILVRESLANRYGFPARNLTTRELARRMEDEGVDRWHARLVDGVLEACDAVVYAGYLPAPERRAADLTMAAQVLEANA